MTQSVKEFAEGIKAQYPEYSDMNNNVLTNKILEKFPERSSEVDLGSKHDIQMSIQKKGMHTLSQPNRDISFLDNLLIKSGGVMQVGKGLAQGAENISNDLIGERATETVKGLTLPLQIAAGTGAKIAKGGGGIIESFKGDKTLSERSDELAGGVSDLSTGVITGIASTIGAIPVAVSGAIFGMASPEIEAMAKSLSSTDAVKFLVSEYEKFDPLQKKFVGNTLETTIDLLGLKALKKAGDLKQQFLNEETNRIKRLNGAKKQLAELQASKKVLEVADIERIAKEVGITDLPASATGSDLTARIEGALAEGFFGQGFKKEAQQAIDKFDEFAGDISRKGQLKESLGEDISKTFIKAKKAEDDMVTQLYKKASEAAEAGGKAIRFETTKTASLLDRLLERAKLVVGLPDTDMIKKLEGLKQGLSGEIIIKGIKEKGKKFVSVDQAEETRKRIGDLANFNNFNPTTNEKNFRNIYNTLKEEIGESITAQVPEFKEILDLAKSKFKQVKALEKRAFVQSIRSLSDKKQFDKIIKTFTSPSASVVDIRDAYKVLGEEMTEKIQKSIMADMVTKAKGAKENFTPAGFSKQFKTLGKEKMAVLFNNSQLKQLKDLDILNQALAKSQRVTGGSQTAIIQNLMKILSLTAAASTFGKSLLAEAGIVTLLRTKTGKNFLKGLGNSESRKIDSLIKKIEKLEKTTAPLKP